VFVSHVAGGATGAEGMHTRVTCAMIPEFLVIRSCFVRILFLFGGKKIPEFIKGLGKAIEEFRRASKES